MTFESASNERLPDVLQHADRDERVAGTGDVAIVVLDELDPALEPFAPRAVAGPAHLFADRLNALTRTP